jgi:formamidopyrimidine-DNA glycosylase
VVYVSSLDAPQAIERLQHLGLEPLTSAFTLAAFAAGLRQRKSAIKQVLLAGHVVVGVGNIYASEVLFLSGIHPLTPANQLSCDAVARLHRAIPQVLQLALEDGGTTLRNYSNAQGRKGTFQNSARVYGKEGHVCQQCHQSQITRLLQQQRSTFFCPTCQPHAPFV